MNFNQRQATQKAKSLGEIPHLLSSKYDTNLEETLKKKSNSFEAVDAMVVSKDHANCDSFPLRYGIHFSADTVISLSNIKFLYPDSKYSDRFHIEARFLDFNREEQFGHFVVGSRRGYREPVIVTVWRDDANTEIRLSEVMVALRIKGFITPQTLLELHPLYVEGKINTSADLIEQLAYKMSSERISSMQSVVDAALEKADEAIAERDEALQRAKKAEEIVIEASMLVDKLQEKNESLAAKVDKLEAERQRYKLELEAARRDNKRVTLSTPDTLLEVRENQLYRSSRCTILIMGDGSQRHMKTSTFDPYGSITSKAKSLIGKQVRISCWDPIGQPGRWSNEGYFRNLYATE